MTASVPATEVGMQRPSADYNRCWGDSCYWHRGPQRPVPENDSLGLCAVCREEIVNRRFER